ncbi:MAG: ABC-2 family transporter protein [Clostridiales bacterium]|nr:ABC-2 family transporter protein [Clostridiales bacterium]
MIKELRLYPKYVSMSLRSGLSYKADSIIMMISFAITEVVSLGTIYLIVSTVPAIGIWTFETLAFLFGFTLVPKAIDHIFTDELWMLAYWAIRRGELDMYLTRPINPLFQFIAKTFKWDGIGEFVVGIVIMSIFGPQSGIAWSAGGVIALILCAILGIFCFTGIKLLFASVAFWVKTAGIFLNTVYEFSNYAKYPVRYMGKAFTSIMFFVIPFGLFLYYPVECLVTGNNIWWSVLWSAIAAVILMTLALAAWHVGIRNYESAGN